MKVKRVATLEEADALERSVTASAARALTNIQDAANGTDAIKVLWQMKSASIGCDPLDADSPLNLIEQLNQTFTYIASARAVKLLLIQHPEDGPFKLNLGTTAGSDIESENGRIAAEVFAAVNTSNNRKLAKDLQKVGATAAETKYIFFMCPGMPRGRQQRLERDTDVRVWSVGAEI